MRPGDSASCGLLSPLQETLSSRWLNLSMFLVAKALQSHEVLFALPPRLL